VWEWTSSRFLPYPSTASHGPINRYWHYVYRGGSWSRRFPKWMRTMLRNRYKPDGFSASIGVRCAKSITPLACPPDTQPKDGACVRVRGQVKCEAGYSFRGGVCRLDGAMTASTPHARIWQKPAGTPGTSASAAANDEPPIVSRARTSHHDGDCKRNWPATPAAYVFRGGKTYASRKSMVAGAGCVPRDMGATWTSACCGG
jgi:hypothetical protein